MMISMGSGFEISGESGNDFFLESVDPFPGEFHNAKAVVDNQWGEVNSNKDLGGLVAFAGFRKCGIRGAAALHGEIVTLAPVDLGGEDGIQLEGEIVMAGGVHAHFFIVAHPVQIAPDLAPDQFPRARGSRQRTDGLQERGEDANVGGVLVGRIVGVDDLRAGRPILLT
jgi:hypothetical protein